MDLFCYLCLSLPNCGVCFLQHHGYLLGKAWPRCFLYVMFSCVCFLCIFFTFPFGVLGQVWYLIVSIPDLCFLSYLKSSPLILLLSK